MRNSINSGHPLHKSKGNSRRSFILILDWMLVKATLITWMHLSPYPNFYKAEKAKSQSTVSKDLRKYKDITERFLSSLFGTSIMLQKVEEYKKLLYF